MLSRPAVTTAAEVLAILKEAFGDQRSLSALLTAFHNRRQGIYERVLEYAQSLVMLSTKVNEAKAGTVTDEMLRDRFVDGLHVSSLRRDIRRFVRERDGATFQQARAEALRSMREDNEVEVRTEQVQAAPSPTCQELKELREQIAALTTKTEELQTALQQSALAQPPPRVQSVCYWCRKPGHLERDCRSRRRYEQQHRQQRNTTHTTADRDQGGTRPDSPRRGRGPRFSSQQGN